jgi:hypothetical protein
MRKSEIPSVLAASAIGLMLSIPASVYANPETGPMVTRDAATVSTIGDINPPPGVAVLIGAQGSSNAGLRVRPVIACDQFVSEDVTGPGAFGVASAPGKNLYVCSYSISNGSALQDVQFISGKDSSLGAGKVCTPGQGITATFHLLSNQFVSQGGGIGSLFSVPSHALCIAVTGNGHVSVNVTYASF